jgi:hypothetical protein
MIKVAVLIVIASAYVAFRSLGMAGMAAQYRVLPKKWVAWPIWSRWRFSLAGFSSKKMK